MGSLFIRIFFDAMVTVHRHAEFRRRKLIVRKKKVNKFIVDIHVNGILV